jgi:hypothetical protein
MSNVVAPQTRFDPCRCVGLILQIFGRCRGTGEFLCDDEIDEAVQCCDFRKRLDETFVLIIPEAVERSQPAPWIGDDGVDHGREAIGLEEPHLDELALHCSLVGCSSLFR